MEHSGLAWGCVMVVSHCSENVCYCVLLQASTGSNGIMRRNKSKFGRIQ